MHATLKVARSSTLWLRMHAGPSAGCLPRTRIVPLHQLHFLQEPAIMCFIARLFLLGTAGKHYQEGGRLEEPANQLSNIQFLQSPATVAPRRPRFGSRGATHPTQVLQLQPRSRATSAGPPPPDQERRPPQLPSQSWLPQIEAQAPGFRRRHHQWKGPRSGFTGRLQLQHHGGRQRRRVWLERVRTEGQRREG
jgi:hypothetical protein